MSCSNNWKRSVAIYGSLGFVYLCLSITMILLTGRDQNEEHQCKLDQLPKFLMVSGWIVLVMSIILIILASIAAALVVFGKSWIFHRTFAGLVCVQMIPLIYGSGYVLGELIY